MDTAHSFISSLHELSVNTETFIYQRNKAKIWLANLQSQILHWLRSSSFLFFCTFIYKYNVCGSKPATQYSVIQPQIPEEILPPTLLEIYILLLLFLCPLSIISVDHMYMDTGNHPLKQWFSTFLKLQTFYTVPQVVVTTNHKVICC